MRTILAALLAAFCGAAGCARPVCETAGDQRQLIDRPLEAGRYRGSALRRGDQAPDRQFASQWAMTVDRAAGELHLVGPGVVETRPLEALPRSAHKLDCFSCNDGLRLETFRVGGPLHAGELSLEEPLLVATCPGAGVLLTELGSGDEWKNAGLLFEPAP